MSAKLTLLGCGNSSGVPAAGNYWGKCDPDEPKNRRNRCSLAVQSEETTIIIDTGADFRHQMNGFNIERLDAVFYTHQHSDHCHGIDDLRGMFFRGGREPIPCFSSQAAMDEITDRFNYLFDGGVNKEIYVPMLKAHAFDAAQYGAEQRFNDIKYTPFEMDHGTCTAVGYRFGDVSYCVDMKSLSDDALRVIKGSKIWIVDGAGHNNPDNKVHADLETLYKYQEIIGAEQVYVTCLSSFMDYAALKAELPSGFYPAYDGLTLDAL